MADFHLAALRHYDDARFLNTDRRLPSADHLAGLAAECALKQILLSFMGGRLNPQGKPLATIKGQAFKLGHLPPLWGQMQSSAAGRTAGHFAALITTPNPFARWNVADRYADGKAITASQVTDHLAAAGKILRLLQLAQVTGVLP